MILQCFLNTLDLRRTTDIKPSNILVNYGSGENRFSDINLADCGGAVSVDSEFAKDGVPTGTSLFGRLRSILRFRGTVLQTFGASVLQLFCPELFEFLRTN
jgi:hypothetical protein